MNMKNLTNLTIATSCGTAKSRIVLFGLFCALFLGSVADAKVYKADIRSVEAKMLAPISGTAERYSSFPVAQSAMQAQGAHRALFSFTVRIPEQLCSREDIGLYLGVIYDQDRVSLNGELIGITADPENVNFRKTAKPRLYLMPKRLLHCTGENNITIDARSLIGKRLGPLGAGISLGPWWELEIMADHLQEYLLFFREIGFLILSVTLMLLALFRKYSQNRLQMAFVSFSFWAGLMCISLSGWLFSLINHPKFLYSFHAALVCVMLVEFSRLLSLYAEIPILPKLSHLWSGVVSLGVFCLLFAFFPSNVMVQIYRLILLGFIVCLAYLLFHGYAAQHFKTRSMQGVFLILTAIGVVADTARIWGVHSGPNISAYLIAISVVGLGLLLAGELVEVFKMAANTQRMKDEKERYEILSNMAQQVAHDIRSPLAALDSVIKDVSQLPEEKRIIIRSAVGRIRDIANNLLEKHRHVVKTKSANADKTVPAVIEPAGIYLLSSLIDPLISEKRLQYRSKIGIEIEARLDAASYGLFAEIHPTEFKRVLSNLINNSVEALNEKGMIMASMFLENGQIFIKVQDTGKGIPPGTLQKLGQRGETHGKLGGSGLGLYHARTSVESWGGSLEIESHVGKGTTLIIKLPAVQPPAWFISKLELKPKSSIVILDDDTSIHQVWQGRFDSIRAKEHAVEIIHFSTPAELRNFVRDNPVKAGNALYLTDYELLGYKETGLSLVKELNLGDRTILVTSRYEEKQILEDCLRLKVRMIPKGLAGLVPLQMSDSVSATTALADPPEKCGREGIEENKTHNTQQDKAASASTAPSDTAVLLDDDPLIHMTWKMAARANGIKLQAYKKVDDFLAQADALDKQTAIYIDSELGDGVKGEDIAKTLHEKGFTNIYMETGHPPEQFAHLPFIKQVLSKEPPWG